MTSINRFPLNRNFWNKSLINSNQTNRPHKNNIKVLNKNQQRSKSKNINSKINYRNFKMTYLRKLQSQMFKLRQLKEKLT